MINQNELIVDIDLVSGVKLSNTAEWRTEAAHFEEFGFYTKHPRSDNPNSGYYKYWVEQARRSVYGYQAGAYFIPGYYYFYLNFAQIKKIVFSHKDDPVGVEVFGFPDIWDLDYDYFTYLENAETAGQHGCVLKTRRRGYSFKGASMMCRNYFLIPMSNSYAVAYEKEFLVGGDGLLTKAWDIMDFLDKNTAWAKRRQYKKTDLIKRASFEQDRGGLKIEEGYKSNIIGLSLKNNVDRIRGKRGKLMLFEESGKNPYLKQAWNIALRSVKQGRQAFGLMVPFGTGGTEGGDFEALEDMFLHPKKYFIFPVKNIWEPTFSGQDSGFFSPEYKGRSGLVDKNGNSLISEALIQIEEDRQFLRDQNATPEDIARNQAEEPIYPSEAMMRIGGTMFPVSDLRKRRAEVESQPHKYFDTFWRGSFVINERGESEFNVDTSKQPIWEFPYYGKDTSGCTIIFEQPTLMHGEIPYGQYIAGTDPYNHSTAGSGASLGSTFIFNRLTDRIVAEYTARPLTDEMYYEQVRRLLMYYNARCNYENSNTGMYAYMKRMHSEWLLTDTPSVLVDKIHDKTVFDRLKGTPPTERINKYARERILAWLVNPIIENKNDKTGLLNLNKICSVPLLRELEMWNKDMNADRISALGMVMIQREEDYHIELDVTKKEKGVDQDDFWDRSLGINNEFNNTVSTVSKNLDITNKDIGSLL